MEVSTDVIEVFAQLGVIWVHFGFCSSVWTAAFEANLTYLGLSSQLVLLGLWDGSNLWYALAPVVD